jgi:hypothetical protein
MQIFLKASRLLLLSKNFALILFVKATIEATQIQNSQYCSACPFLRVRHNKQYRKHDEYNSQHPHINHYSQCKQKHAQQNQYYPA